MHFLFLSITLLAMPFAQIIGLWVFAIQIPALILSIYFGWVKSPSK
jgi:hypothetical protein